jgi:hypothetical protein
MFRLTWAPRTIQYRHHVEFVPVPKERAPHARRFGSTRARASGPRAVQGPDGARRRVVDGRPRVAGPRRHPRLVRQAPASPKPEVAVFASRSVDVLAVPETARSHRASSVPISADARDAARVDAGVVRFAPRGEPRLSVFLPDGKPAAWTSLRVIRGDVVRNGLQAAVFDPSPPTLARPVRRRRRGEGRRRSAGAGSCGAASKAQMDIRATSSTRSYGARRDARPPLVTTARARGTPTLTLEAPPLRGRGPLAGPPPDRCLGANHLTRLYGVP